jgi:hypothetical protein
MLGVAVGIMTTRQKEMAKYFCANIVLSYFLFRKNCLDCLHVRVRACVPSNNLRIKPHASIKLGIHSTTVLFITYLQ